MNKSIPARRAARRPARTIDGAKPSRPRKPYVSPPLDAERLGQVARFSHENMSRPGLSIADMSAAIGLTQFHFSRRFKKATGITPHQYLIRVRLAEARRLLATTCLAIEEIAHRCGYSTHAHFTSVFARGIGMTPAAFRIEARSMKRSDGRGNGLVATNMRDPAQPSRAAGPGL